MLGRNLLHDGQAQARAIGLIAQGTVKGLQYQLFFFGTNARAVVFHLEHHMGAKTLGQHPGGHHGRALGGGGAVVDGVGNQIAHHLLQQRGVAHDPNAGVVLLGPFVAQIGIFGRGQGQHLLHHGHHQRDQIARLMLQAGAAHFGTGQGQQLVHRVRGPHAGAANELQRAL